MQPSLFIDDVYLSDNVRMDDLLIAWMRAKWYLQDKELDATPLLHTLQSTNEYVYGGLWYIVWFPDEEHCLQK